MLMGLELIVVLFMLESFLKKSKIVESINCIFKVIIISLELHMRFLSLSILSLCGYIIYSPM